MAHQERFPPRLDVFGDPLPPQALSRCGTLRLWHPPEEGRPPDSLEAVSFSPDSRRVVSASGCTARVWDLEDGRELLALSGHRDTVRALHYVSSTRIVTASRDDSVRLWDAESGAELCRWSLHGGGATCLALSPDKRTLLAGSWSANGFAVIDLMTQELLRWVCPEGEVGNTAFLVFSPDGSRVATVERTFDLSRLCILDVATWSLCWSAEDGGEYTPAWAAFSEDGRSVIRDVSTVGWRTLRRTFDTRTGALLAEAENPLNLPIPLSDGTSVRASSGQLEFLRDGEVVRGADLRVRSSDMKHGLVVSPDSRWALLTGGPATLALIELSSGRVLPARAHRDCVMQLTFSRDGKHLVSSSLDGSVRTWNCATGIQEACADLGRGSDHWWICLTRGRALQVRQYGDVFIRDVLAGTEVEPEIGHIPSRIAWSVDGTLLAHLDSWYGDQFAFVHDTRTGKLIRKVALRLENDRPCALSRDGRFLVTGARFQGRSSSYGFRLWDLEDGTVCFEQALPHDMGTLVFSPDERWLAFEEGPDALALLELKHPERRLRVELSARLSAFAFSEDGRFLATGDQEGRVQVWRVNGELLGVLEGHRALVNALAFSSDGALLASGGADTTVLLWPERAWLPGGR
ncbi:hypothetical protein JQX13_27685 [Archangium violaceum]|uniref:WD40 repeat domain-containing protein n=1 Tax=Archangium violaceum TaxID=83451 RepID=UPI00193B21D3|nr:hypothetical protein [Archangium violaceum]QRK04059.1 hypothetical protein JQX13_27685 [Archangium violaceum]